MPPQEIAFCYQKALLWAATGVDNFDKYTVSSTPVEIDVRWDGSSSEMMDPKRNAVTVDASAVVDQEIPMGSQMWLGSLVDYAAAAGPDLQIMEVKVTNYVPDLKDREVFRKVGLMRLRNKR